MTLPIGTSFRQAHGRTQAADAPSLRTCTCRAGVQCPACRAYQLQHAGVPSSLVPTPLPLTASPAYLRERLAEAERRIMEAQRATPPRWRRVKYWQDRVRWYKRRLAGVEETG
jgi:hypothetical protein